VPSRAASQPADAQDIPAWGAASRKWADQWEWGFVSGNGTMGGLIYGQPGTETFIATHARLWLPLGSREIVPDIGRYLPECRRAIAERGFGAGQSLLESKAREQGWSGLVWTDPFHPAFFLRLALTRQGKPRDYLRTEDFASGEVATRWNDDAGRWRHRMFVSRPDNLIVLQIMGPAAGKLSGSLSVDKAVHPSIEPDLRAAGGWITGHMTYKKGKGGFDYAIRVTVGGGKLHSGDAQVVFEGADEVLAVARVVPWKVPLPGSEAWAYNPANPIFEQAVSDHRLHAAARYRPQWMDELKADLAAAPTDYAALLAPHARMHGELFHRATLDLAGGGDRRETIESLFQRAADDKDLPPALTEKLYDAGRYMLLCAAGESAPNLYGIWTGTWSPAFSGDYTTDANVQCAVACGLSANLPELMQGYFNTVESWIPDMRLNARRIYGCRGALCNTRASNNCLFLHFGDGWPGEAVTSCGGWLAHWFYEYYEYTGDREFLAKRTVPLLKQCALFYEDFLRDSRDEKGKFRFCPSMSPESMTGANATIDIAVAREVLTNLIAASEELHADRDRIPHWKALLAQMPPYLVNGKGELQEMADPRRPDVPYDHRHHSLLYPVFQSHEFTPEQTPELWRAAKASLEGKLPRHCEGSSFGRIQSGLAAAYLRMGDGAYGQIRKMALEGKWYTSLMTSHDPNHQFFCADANGGVPEIVDNMLVFTRPGQIDLLPALPAAWPRGEIRGILGRGQLTIRRLAWDRPAGKIQLTLSSGKDQALRLRLPNASAIKSIRAEGATLGPSPGGENCRELSLRKGIAATVEITD
jgi:hypothetical protein